MSIIVKDLFVLVADKRMQDTLSVVLKRHASIGMRRIDFDIQRTLGHDSDSYRHSSSFLKFRRNDYQHALTIFDYEGCGAEERKNRMLPLEIEQQLNSELSEVWGDRAKAIAIVPELEKWIWSQSPHFTSSLGWKGELDVWTWVQQNNFTLDGNGKPDRPKEALKAALLKTRIPMSTSIYKAIAEKVSLKNCQDAAFNRMLNYLRNWFPLT